MRENALSYGEIVEYFGETKITDRYRFLYDKMLEYITVRNQKEKLFICEPILQQVVMDYFADIYRLKEFHKIDKANITKILAYEAYWILRRKPLQIRPEVWDSKLAFCNEGFITTFLAHELLIPEETEPMSTEEEKRFLKYLQHLNYHLKYRQMDKQGLEAMLYSYETGRMMGS